MPFRNQCLPRLFGGEIFEVFTMKKFFIFVALCAVTVNNGVQGGPSEKKILISKRQAHNYPPFRGPYGSGDRSPDRDMDYGPGYFEQDMIQRGAASIFDKSYLCMASCVEPLVEDMKQAIWGPASKKVADLKPTILNYAGILCGQRASIDQCTEKCPDGSAKTAVETFLPLYEIACTEWDRIRIDLDCVISSVESSHEKLYNCTRENNLMIGMITAFGQIRSISDVMRAVRNNPGFYWKLSQCYIDAFRQSITECKDETVEAVGRISQQVERTRCDILDKIGVSKKEAPKTCNSCVKLDATTLVGLLFMVLLMKIFK